MLPLMESGAEKVIVQFRVPAVAGAVPTLIVRLLELPGVSIPERLLKKHQDWLAEAVQFKFPVPPLVKLNDWLAGEGDPFVVALKTKALLDKLIEEYVCWVTT